MTVFLARDKKPIADGRKWLTLRPLSHREKGGSRYTLMCERVKGGFGSAELSRPYFFDVRFIDDYFARALGYDSAESYLAENYNTGNPSPLRKAYLISDFVPNETGAE